MIGFFGRIATIATHRIFTLPVMVLMPHSRCNCRCVMCDIWKANHGKKEIATETLEKHLHTFRKLGVQRVALSGGEALMHANLWKFCDLLKTIDTKISLLSTGITLAHHAENVVKNCDDIVVSLDGDKETHDRIRNIPGAFERLSEGIRAVKAISGTFRITGRTVLQKQNFRNLPKVIRAAKEIGLDQISFLAADVSSEAFNRPEPWTGQKVSQISLSEEEVLELEGLLRKSFIDFGPEYNAGFIAESRTKMMDILQHYRAINQTSDYPEKKCNAPWVSAVIESNGDVLPCFFHPAYGNIYSGDFEEIINSKKAVSFRRQLKVNDHPTCRQCVCSLQLGIMQSV